MKLIEAYCPIPEPLYLNLFINSLPEEFDVLVNTIDYDMDMVNKVVSSLQIETKRGLYTTEGSAFAMLKKKPIKPAMTPQSVGCICICISIHMPKVNPNILFISSYFSFISSTGFIAQC